MKLTYHPRYNVAYIALKDKTDQVETISLSDDVKVDLASDGAIYGIELLNANAQLAERAGRSWSSPIRRPASRKPCPSKRRDNRS